MAIDGTTYTRLTGPGYGFGTEFGMPDLPVVRRHVEVPWGAEVTVEMVDVETIEYRLSALGIKHTLYPLQPPVSKQPGAQENQPFVIDTDFYAGDNPYPNQTVAITDEYVVRGHRVVVVEFWPIAYHPGDELVHVHTEAQLRLTLTGSDMAKTHSLRTRYESPAFEGRLSRQLLNYDLGGSYTPSGVKSSAGYLIITADAYESAMTPFADLKTAQGFDVTVTALSDIAGGATTTAIKSYIQNAYDTWTTPPSYVLLVGDTDTLPGWNSVSAGEVTDLYYGTMDGSGDWVPDIERGRFPVRSTTQATYMVDKAIGYANLNRTEDWLEKIAFIATCDQYTVAEGTHNYAIDSYTEPEGYTGIFPNNPQAGGDQLYCITHGADDTDIQASLNDERWAVIYSGHGGWTGWEMGYGSSDVQALTSVGTFPFVASHACITGDFAQTEVFGETWVLQENKGALVFWGSSDSSYWGEDDVLERATFDALFSVPQPTIGGMTDFGLAAVQSDYPGSARYYWETYNLLGDPSISLITDSPDFTLTASPLQHEVATTGVATYTVQLGSILAYNEEVTLQVLGLPSDTQAQILPDQGIPPFTSELVVTTTAATPLGTHPLTIQGSDAFGNMHATQVGLVVTPRPSFTLEFSAHTAVVEIGTELLHTITISNSGGPATGVTISDTLPANTTLAWADSGGTMEGDALVWRDLAIPTGGMLNLGYGLTVGCVPTGTQVINDGYWVSADELLTPAWGETFTVTTKSDGVTANFDVAPPVLTRWPISFSDHSVNATIFDWTFGDGNHATEKDPQHTYNTPGPYDVVLTASNACHADTVTHTLDVEEYGVDLAATVASLNADPGQAATFTLWITNSGTLSETFNVDLGTTEWRATVTPGSVSLEAGESTTATVSVTVPPQTEGGDTCETRINVKATSDPRRPSASAFIDLTTQANVARGVSLSAPLPTQTGDPGDTLTYVLWITNTGNALDTLTFTRVDAGWPTTITPTSRQIAPFGIRQIEVEITVPAAATPDDVDVATIRVTGTGVTDEVTLTTRLARYRTYLPLVVRD